MKTENSENEWTDTTSCGAYEKSKTLAEKAAMGLLTQPARKREIRARRHQPITDPWPIDDHWRLLFWTCIMKIMSGKFPGMPKIMFPIIDVRDIAFAHL